MSELHSTNRINGIGLRLSGKFLGAVKTLKSRAYNTYIRWDIARDDGMQTHLVVNNTRVEMDDVEMLVRNQVTLNELRAKYSK
jgi:hypothetical protein